MDASLVSQNLAGNFMGVVQYNKDNTAFEVRLKIGMVKGALCKSTNQTYCHHAHTHTHTQGRPNNITIEDLCSMMVDPTLGSPVQRYSEVNRMMTHNTSLDCNYKSYIDEMKNESWTGNVTKAGGQSTSVSVLLQGVNFIVLVISG